MKGDPTLASLPDGTLGTHVPPPKCPLPVLTAPDRGGSQTCPHVKHQMDKAKCHSSRGRCQTPNRPGLRSGTEAGQVQLRSNCTVRFYKNFQTLGNFNDVSLSLLKPSSLHSSRIKAINKNELKEEATLRFNL